MRNILINENFPAKIIHTSLSNYLFHLLYSRYGNRTLPIFLTYFLALNLLFPCYRGEKAFKLHFLNISVAINDIHYAIYGLTKQSKSGHSHVQLYFHLSQKTRDSSANKEVPLSTDYDFYFQWPGTYLLYPVFQTSHSPPLRIHETASGLSPPETSQCFPRISVS